MRLKQQSFVDKYIEMVILGVAALISIAILYFYVFSTPYHVEVAPGKIASPAEVEEAYLAQASTLKQAIARTEPPEELANLKIPDYVSRFNARYDQRLVKSDSFYGIVFGPPGLSDLGIVDGPAPVLNPLVVQPAAPKDVTVQAAYHVLDSDENIRLALTDVARAQYPDAKEDAIAALVNSWTTKAVSLAGDQEPRDFWSVTVSGTINPQDWLDAYGKVADDRRMPESWYQDLAQFISGIEIQRQTLDPKTGQWGNDTTIEALPGAVSDILRSYVKQVQDAKNANVEDDESAQLQQALIENLRFYQEDLVKPQFLPVKAHRPWTAPDQVHLELAPEDQQALLKINQQINKYESELRALIGRTGVGNGDTTRPGGIIPPRIDGRFSEEGYVPDPRGKTPSRINPKSKQPGPGVDPSKKAPDRNEERIKLYQTRLDGLYQQRDAILSKLHKEEPAAPGETDPAGPRGRTRTEPRPEFIDPEFQRPGTGRGRYTGGQYGQPGGEGLLPADGKLQPIKFWAHDPSVQPGTTYRYRVSYRVVNPLFNKESQLVEPLKQKATKLEESSLASDWAAPVTIEPPVRFFVEDVRPETSTVTWGIYRIHNGYRIHKQFVTRPGDPIGKTVDVDVKDDLGAAAGKLPVDLSVERLLLDLKTPAKQAGVLGVRGPMTVLVADMEGSVSMRDPASDREDPDRIRLFNEATGALNAVVPVGAGGAGEFPGGRPPSTVVPFEGGFPPR